MSTVAEKLARKTTKRSTTKQVRLRLVYVDFWSVTKLAFLLSICAAVVLIVAGFLIAIVVGQTGLIDQLNSLLSGDSAGVNFNDFLGFGPIMLISLIFAVLSVFVGTALGAVGALIYNLSVRITGGLTLGFVNH